MTSRSEGVVWKPFDDSFCDLKQGLIVLYCPFDFVSFQSKFKSTSKSSHDLLNDPKLSKVVGIEVEKDDYIEESAASSSKPAVEIESIRNKLSSKKSSKSSSKSKPVENADRNEEDENMTESERKRAEVIMSNTDDIRHNWFCAIMWWYCISIFLQSIKAIYI